MKARQHSFRNRENEQSVMCVRDLRLALGRGGVRFARYGDVSPLPVGFRGDDAE